MLKYDWPGNIRQLHNCIRQCSFGLLPDYLLQIQAKEKEDESLDAIINEKTRELIKDKIKMFIQKNEDFSMKDVASSFLLTVESFRRRLQRVNSDWKNLKKECEEEIR